MNFMRTGQLPTANLSISHSLYFNGICIIFFPIFIASFFCPLHTEFIILISIHRVYNTFKLISTNLTGTVLVLQCQIPKGKI